MTVRTRQECFEIITNIVQELLEDMGEEPGEIELTTMLSAELGITSIDAIHMMIMLEDELEQPLSFQELAIRDGEYIDDLSVGELLQFVTDRLGLAPADSRFPTTAHE